MVGQVLPDAMGSALQGIRAGAAMTQIRNQNKLADLGPGLAAGDPNALAQMYAIDPMKAMELQRMQREQERNDVRWDRESTEWQWKVDEYARTKNAAELKAERDEIARGLSGAAYYHENGDRQGFEEYIAGLGDAAAGVTFDNFPAVASQYEAVMDRLDYWAQRNAGPEPMSTPGKVEHDRRAGLLPEDYAGDGDGDASDRAIARMMETGIPREIAIKIEDGVYTTDRHPITGELQVVDLSTGQMVWKSGGPAAPSEPGRAPAPPRGDTGQPGLSFDSEIYGDAPNAFGAEGFLRGAVNTVSDAIGAGPVWPETMQTQADFNVLTEKLVNDIASGYDRPPSWLLQRIRALAPAAGEFFQGPGEAQAKLKAIRRDLKQEYESAQAQLENRQLSPNARQVLETRMFGLFSALDRVNTALGAFVAKDDGNTTSSGVKWKVVD